jgi:hypothetical protein
MLRFADLSRVQRQIVLEFLVAKGDAVSERHQHDAVIVEAECGGDLLDRIRTADFNEGAREPQPAKPFVARTPTPDDPPSVRAAAWVHSVIAGIYEHRWNKFVSESPSEISKPIVDDLSVHTFDYLRNRFGVTTLVKQHAEELLRAIRVYRDADLTIQIFGVLLSSAAYDTIDVRAMLEWRVLLVPYTSIMKSGSDSKRVVEVRMIPALLRKCLRCASPKLREMVRRAMTTWLNPQGAFPSEVEDPNFYAPPFHVNNPYVGKMHGSCPHDVEQHFAYHGSAGSAVDVAQLHALLLMNFKQERIAAENATSTPNKRTSHALTSSILSPTLASMGKQRAPTAQNTARTVHRERPPRIADVSVDVAMLSQAAARATEDERPRERSDKPTPQRIATMPLHASKGGADDTAVEIPEGTSVEDVQNALEADVATLEAKLARVVNSFVRNRPRN